LMQGIDKNKFSLLLSRIVKTLHLKNEKPFSDSEKQQLKNVLKLNENEVDVLIEACSFIFEQSAYYNLQPSSLQTHLEKAALKPEQVSAFVSVWENEREALLGQFRGRTSLIGKKLDKVEWELHLQMAQSSVSRLKNPSAVFDFSLKNVDSNQPTEKFEVEFSHQQLYELYSNLEKIQDQLDALSA